MAYNAAVLPLALLGELAPWQSALGMSASSLIVVVNGVRAARLRGAAAMPNEARGARQGTGAIEPLNAGSGTP